MTLHNVYPIFPTSIATFEYEKREEFKRKVLSYLEENKEKLDDTDDYGVNILHLHNKATENFLDYCKDDDFENFLIDSCKYYLQEIIGDKVDDLIVTDCWINICGTSGAQPFHNHSNSYISGTYYLNYDPDNHSHLKFNNPHRSNCNVPFLSLDFDKITPYNARDLTCSFIKEGFLALWPSQLSHGYEVNNSEGRITISMNFLPKRFSSGPYSFSIVR